MNRGFTLIELLVSLAIFVSMTALVVAKYGTFNQSTLLTDTGYDIALVVRLAQSYGLSVKNAGASGSQNFVVPYGVDLYRTAGGAACGGATSGPSSIILFADASPVGAPDGACGASDTSVSTYVITGGATLSNLCVGTDAASCHQPSNSVTRLDISFLRPNPESIICAGNGGTPVCGYTYAELTIVGSDGSTRTVSVRQNGQISIQH